MEFNVEGMLDSAKEKAVNAATEKFGNSATPIAEKVADKMEEVVANKLGVPLHPDADAPSNAPSGDTTSDSNQNQ